MLMCKPTQRRGLMNVPKDKVCHRFFTACKIQILKRDQSLLARLKLKRSSPHFNDGFLVTFKDFRCKENFSSWCVPTIICNFVSSENDILLAFHFVDQFLKIWFSCFIYIPSSHSGTQLFSGFDWKFVCCYLTGLDSVARYEKWFPDNVYYQMFSQNAKIDQFQSDM